MQASPSLVSSPQPTLYLRLQDAVVPLVSPRSSLSDEAVHERGQHRQKLDVIGLAPGEQLTRREHTRVEEKFDTKRQEDEKRSRLNQ